MAELLGGGRLASAVEGAGPKRPPFTLASLGAQRRPKCSLLAFEQNRVAEALFLRFERDDPISQFNAVPGCRSRAVTIIAPSQCCHDERTNCLASGRHLVNLTRNGGETAATLRPSLSRAASKCVAIAHATAAGPNPLPGSDTSRADSTSPSGLTTTFRTTTCSETSSASASRGQGHDQAPSSTLTGLDLSSSRFTGAGSTCVKTASWLVPAAVVTPPA